MTGVSGLVSASGNSGLNNVSEYKFLSGPEFSKYYGFTEVEVFELLKHFEIYEKCKDDIKSWYDGYKVFGTEMAIYNTWSIVKYLNLNVYDAYWEKSGRIDNMSKIFKLEGIRNKIIDLITHRCVEFELMEKFDIEDSKNLQTLVNYNLGVISDNHVQLFFSFLFELGYLSFDNSDSDKTKFTTPNKEIKSGFARLIRNYSRNT